MFLLDTSAWIEFFTKGQEWERIGGYLKTGNCYTSVITICEIANWAFRQNLNSQQFMQHVLEITRILNLTTKIAFFAGELNFRRKFLQRNWGMVDSIILATAQNYDMKILTKDSHFKDLPDVEMI